MRGPNGLCPLCEGDDPECDFPTRNLLRGRYLGTIVAYRRRGDVFEVQYAPGSRLFQLGTDIRELYRVNVWLKPEREAA